MITRKQKIYLALLLLCFFSGAYIWRITTKPVKLVGNQATGSSRSDSSGDELLVFVADTPITVADVDFEYQLHTKTVFIDDETPLSEDEKRQYEKRLTPLREKLLAGIIERKVLYHMIKQDRNFDVEDPTRLKTCNDTWKQTIAEGEPNYFKSPWDEKLKQRLCEKSIIEQYLREHVYAPISISDEEMKTYYDAHSKEFSMPKRVIIRQIVLTDEEEARNLQRQLNRQNFAEKARELSITPEASKGGLLGPFAQGEMPKFFDLAFSMSRGEIYGVLKSPYGFHILMLEQNLPKTQKTFSESRDIIHATLTKKYEQEAYKKWLEQAINAIPVKTAGARSY